MLVGCNSAFVCSNLEDCSETTMTQIDRCMRIWLARELLSCDFGDSSACAREQGAIRRPPCRGPDGADGRMRAAAHHRGVFWITVSPSLWGVHRFARVVFSMAAAGPLFQTGDLRQSCPPNQYMRWRVPVGWRYRYHSALLHNLYSPYLLGNFQSEGRSIPCRCRCHISKRCSW